MQRRGELSVLLRHLARWIRDIMNNPVPAIGLHVLMDSSPPSHPLYSR